MEYTIQSGDSLSTIAKKLTGKASNYRLIADLNDIDNPDIIKVGDTLTIPEYLLSPTHQQPIHTVKPGLKIQGTKTLAPPFYRKPAFWTVLLSLALGAYVFRDKLPKLRQ